jgi:heme-degrading monooxygenase HmoA
MIARCWSATAENASAYRDHFTSTVVPNLQALDGFAGCYLLERPGPDGGVALTAVTLWESEEHIRAFAGDEISRAHVVPEGQAALTDFDREVVHHTVSVRAGT